MTFHLKRNWKYILAAILCFLVIPHLPQIFYPEFYQAVIANGNTPMGLSQQFEDYWWMFLLHNYCLYLPPTFAGLLGLIHVRREKEFCPILPLVAYLAVPTFLFWDTNTWAATTMLVAAVSLTFLDGLGVFGLFGEERQLEGGKRPPRLLCGIAQNLRYLALLAFWLITIPIAYQVYFTITVIGDFDNWFWYPFMFYTPIVSLVLPICCHKEDKGMTAGGMLTATILFIISAVISSCLDYCRFSDVNLVFTGVSYLLFLFAEGGMAVHRRRKAAQEDAEDDTVSAADDFSA